MACRASLGFLSGGTDVRERSGGESELIKLSHQTSHEGVGLFSSNISVLVDIESVPCLLKVSFHVSWNLSSLQFVGSLKDDSGSFRGGRFHKNLLAVLDTAKELEALALTMRIVLARDSFLAWFQTKRMESLEEFIIALG